VGAVHAGLDKVFSDVPVRSVYAEALAGWDSRSGGVLRLEGGAHLSAPLSLFGFAELNRTGPMAGLGARYEWDF
jgi:hypothetical protein